MLRHLVTAPVAKRDQTTAPSRTTSDTAIIARNTFTLTAHETSMLPGDRGHCHSISSHSATDQLRSLERQRHAATSASPMTITHSAINKGGRLSNAASSLSQRPSRSATKQLRPLKRRATSRLSERSPSLTYIPQHMRSVCYHEPIILVTAPVAERDQVTAPSRTTTASGCIDSSHDAYTSPNIYKSEKLSNAASSLSQRPSLSSTKQTAHSRTTSGTTTARTLPHCTSIFRI